MKTKIVVAGATGNLGSLIVKALIEKGAEVVALVRPGTESEKLENIQKSGVRIVEVELSNTAELIEACRGTDCVVSALQGLRETIVDAQSNLMEAAIKAGVPRFIPSDYAVDFTKFPDGQNRNLDLRREFHAKLDNAPIAATSVLNGALTFVLTYGSGMLDMENKRVNYWENPDQKMDFTTYENTAEYTAAAALDPSTPKVLRISGSQLSARDIAQIAEDLTGSKFELVNLGSLESLAAEIKRERAADPAGENQVFPKFQGEQYMYNTNLNYFVRI